LSDITERKRAEEALRKLEERFRSMFAQAPLGIAFIDSLTGHIDEVNPRFAEIAGRSMEEMAIIDWMRITHPDDVQEDLDNMALLNAGKISGFHMEKRYLHHDGTPVWINMSIAPILVEDKAHPRHLCMIEDITERKHVEEKLAAVAAELERSNNDLEQFASIAAHDLQEPLRMVASYTQLLAERYEGQLDEKARKYIAYAVDGAVRMQQLVNDLLTYARVGTRGNPIEPTDAGRVLGQAIGDLATAIEESRAVVTHEELPLVRADASQLRQLFQNLLANALKFRSEEVPRVHVSARDEGRDWVFAVRDNGIGIDRQYAERVFVVFQRLHTRRDYPGTGIGLALCKRIVERHGGRIWFESEPGKGSTFLFTVPK
jgi:PAS domain S-box-containing protein